MSAVTVTGIRKCSGARVMFVFKNNIFLSPNEMFHVSVGVVMVFVLVVTVFRIILINGFATVSNNACSVGRGGDGGAIAGNGRLTVNCVWLDWLPFVMANIES